MYTGYSEQFILKIINEALKYNLNINHVDFFDVYQKIIDELMNVSIEEEGINNCIKNITIGVTNFDKEIEGIENYPCLVSRSCDLNYNDFGSKLGINRIIVDKLPQPIENVEYSDSKNVQYLIRGNGIFNFGQSYHNYQDERKKLCIIFRIIVMMKNI